MLSSSKCCEDGRHKEIENDGSRIYFRWRTGLTEEETFDQRLNLFASGSRCVWAVQVEIHLTVHGFLLPVGGRY